MRIKTIIIFLFFSLTLFSQKKEDLTDLFLDAEYSYLYEEFDNAFDLYYQVYLADTNNSNVNYRMGQCILHAQNENKHKREEAIAYLNRAALHMTRNYNEGSYNEKKAPYETLFYLGNAYRFAHDFDKAIVVYEQYLDYLPASDYFYIDFVKREIQACENAKELIKVPVQYDVESLNEEVNQGALIKNCPVVNFDETVIVYTSGGNNSFSPDIDMSAINSDYKMDNIYYTILKDSVWTKPVMINKQLKANKNSVPTTITGDGKKLYIVRDDNDDGNIYESVYNDKKNRWGKMKKLGKNVNTSDWESHASVSEDGRILVFTSDRPGGYGGLDIYKSVFDTITGKWGKAINLGPTINSVYDEETPSIINKGKTLYFSSQGHYGMGGFDIFYSTLLDNGKWTAPLNLGYPLNTVGNDLFYLPKQNGEYAIFPLNNNERKTLLANNIYKIKVPKPGEEATRITLKGNLGIEDNNWPLRTGAGIILVDNKTNDTLNFITANVEDGDYQTNMTSGNFKVIFNAPGYQSRTEYVVIPQIFAKTEFTLNVILKPLKVSTGKYLVIKNIFFDYGKAELKKESHIELEKLYDVMLHNPELYIEIIGHTDSKSSAEFNKKLSKQRAEAAIQYLIEKGISSKRFVAIGKGEETPIAINENPDGTDNPEGRMLNRRVEIKLMNYNGDKIIVETIKVPEQLSFRKNKSVNNDACSIRIIQSEKKISTSYFKEKFGNSETATQLRNIVTNKLKGKYCYYIKGYESKAKALKDLNYLVNNGFEQATIVSPETSASPDTQQQNVKNWGLLTIQIKALQQKVKPATFTKLKGVKYYKGKDGFYRYVYGEYKTYEEATQAKEKIKMEEEGIKDAFIVPIKKLKKY